MPPYPGRDTQADAPAPAHLNRRQLAARLGVSERTVWSETAAGRIPHLRVGARIVYPVLAVEQWEHEQAMGSLRQPELPVPVLAKRTRPRRIVQAVPAVAAPAKSARRPVRPDVDGRA